LEGMVKLMENQVLEFESWRHLINNINAGKSNNYLIGEYWIITMFLMGETCRNLFKKC
jgi:hypothetical protein